jgi:hypothetical protein
MKLRKREKEELDRIYRIFQIFVALPEARQQGLSLTVEDKNKKVIALTKRDIHHYINLPRYEGLSFLPSFREGRKLKSDKSC